MGLGVGHQVMGDEQLEGTIPTRQHELPEKLLCRFCLVGLLPRCNHRGETRGVGGDPSCFHFGEAALGRKWVVVGAVHVDHEVEGARVRFQAGIPEALEHCGSLRRVGVRGFGWCEDWAVEASAALPLLPQLEIASL